MAYYLLLSGLSLLFCAVVIFYYDNTLLLFLEQHRTTFLDNVAISLSYLGGMPTVLVIFGLCSFFFLYNKKNSAFSFLCFGVTGSIGFGWLLKILVNRERPTIVSHLVTSYGSSFPSLHSLYAATLFSLTFYFIHHLKHSFQVSILFFLGSWAVMMGISRSYLGVHYPSDVFAGWGLGCTWVSLLWIYQNLKVQT